MDAPKDIGRRLVALRESHKLNQVEFADTINIAKNTLNGYERGKRPLSLECAKRIRDRWGVSTDWLLYGDVNPPGHELALKLGPRPKIKADDEKRAREGKKRRAS